MAVSCGGRRLLVRPGHLKDLSGCVFQDEAVEEIDACFPPSMDGADQQQPLSKWLGLQATAHRATLRSLRLTGPLCLASVFGAMAPFAAEFLMLESVFLCRGGEDWEPASAARTLRLLPNLQRLQVRFSFGEEELPRDLVTQLLEPPSGLPGTPGLQQLRHLALVYPVRSIHPPTELLPDAMSTLTRLTALKLKRLPVAAEPQFLGALTQLRFLLWDPSLPADVHYVMPPGLGQLTNLECLWIVTQTPLFLPLSLAANLQGLHVIGRNFYEDQRHEQQWDWLAPFKQLKGLRLQGVGMEVLPPEILDKSKLTRLDLMCNQLEVLPEGPYLLELQRLHLGNNHFACFPPAILHAKKLEELYLASQCFGNGSSGRSSPAGGMAPRCGAGFTQRLGMTGADVEGLQALSSLRTVIMGNLQPVVQLGAVQHDFTWLQRVLKRRGVRLTSEELAYELQTKEVFEVVPLELEERKEEAGGAAGGDGNGQEKCDKPSRVPLQPLSHS